jgi:hypothetical protein
VFVCVCVPVRVKSVQSHVTLSQQAGQHAGAAPPAALPAGWRELVDVNGMVYYQNEITRGTQRERPQEAARQVRIFDSMLLAAIFCAYMQALTTSKAPLERR